MPAKLDRCVQHLEDQGKDKSSAFAICTASLKKKKIKLNKEKIKEKITITENIMVGSFAPIASMNGTGAFTIQDIYKAKKYKPVIKGN